MTEKRERDCFSFWKRDKIARNYSTFRSRTFILQFDVNYKHEPGFSAPFPINLTPLNSLFLGCFCLKPLTIEVIT